MDICEWCFESDPISSYIKEEGIKLEDFQKCDNCGEDESIYRLSKLTLQIASQKSILKFYTHENTHGLVGSATQMCEEGDDIDMFLPQLLNLKAICWNLFDLDTVNDEFYELLENKEADGILEFDDDPDYEVWMNMGCDWSGSTRILLNWDDFCFNVKHSARFFDHKKFNRKKELKKLKETFITLSTTTTIQLYRARKIDTEKKHEKIKENPLKELGIAPLKEAQHNRFSPVGIPYVYLSSDKTTVFHEIRAVKNDKVAIGKFKINKLNLVDLRSKTIEKIKKNPFSDKLTSELYCSFKVVKKFITDISQKVLESDQYLDYIPTQIVSEYIWSLGYHGFIFDSSLSQGDNYVLFSDYYEYIDYEVKIL